MVFVRGEWSMSKVVGGHDHRGPGTVKSQSLNGEMCCTIARPNEDICTSCAGVHR